MSLLSGFFRSGGRIVNDDGVELVAIQGATGAAALPVGSASVSKGYQQLTSDGTARTIVSLCSGATLPTGATKVIIIPTATVRFRDDGTSPTSSVGLPCASGNAFVYDGDQLSALKVINAATLDCWFYS